MLAPSKLPGGCCWAYLLAATFFNSTLVHAQGSAGSSSSSSVKHAARAGQNVSRPFEQRCGCSDGRQFSIGASLFGKNSARVLITGFRPQSVVIPTGELAQCTDVLVVGQIVRLFNSQDGRPFLRRQNLKRGVIRNICDTRIHFVEAKKSYDFFADDGSGLTLNEDDTDQMSGPDDPSETADAESQQSPEQTDDDLTGRDLLQLMPAKGIAEEIEDPSHSTFDDGDLKEGAYFVCVSRSKALVVRDDDSQRASTAPSAHNAEQEVNVPAGTLGRIEKRAGFRSESLWVVEVLPDSAPQPFWRSLAALPRAYSGPREPALPRKVILASSQMAEINEFMDRFRVEWTRYGEPPDTSAAPEHHDTTRLQTIYGRPALPLDENLATAQRSRMFEAIQKAWLGQRLVWRNPENISLRGTLVLEESTSDHAHSDAVPDLTRSQCFVGLDKLGDAQRRADGGPPAQALFVNAVDVKVFRPKEGSQVSPDYYAIDLELLLGADRSARQVPLICRFPSASIDLALVDMAKRILANRFEVHRE
jgi:hypothetical protein